MPKWTKEQEQFLIDNYSINGSNYCSKILNKKVNTIRSKAMYLGLKIEDWNQDQINILINNYNTLSINKLEKILKKSYQSIKNKLNELNLKKEYFKFSKEQESWLFNNYSKLGIKKCADFLKIKENQVKAKAQKLKLTLNKETRSKIIKDNYKEKPFEEYNINPSQFLNIQIPEVAYLLGFIWADGYIYQNNRRSVISINCVKKDLDLLIPIFNKTGKWSIYESQKENRQTQLHITTTNKPLVNFLIENDYKSKSNASADKILEKIPEHLKHYWFRGVSDGDGCFYINEKNKCNQFSLASSYDQDWSYFEKICNDLNIKYSIVRRIQARNGKENKSSIIRFTNKQDISSFGNFIYRNYENDKIGLPRKYEKYLIIKNKLKNINDNRG